MRIANKIRLTIHLLAVTVLFSPSGWSQPTDFSPEHLSRTFSEAITFNNTTNLVECLKIDPELVNEELPGGDTPLIAAARWHNDEALEFFLAKGADANATGRRAETALHLAAQREDAKTTKLLLKHKADPNAANSDDYTPMMSAKSIETFKALVGYGANVNASTRFGDTALSRAVEFKVGTNVIQFLLNNGADVVASPALPKALDFCDDTNVAKLLVPYYRNSKNPDAPKAFAHLLSYLVWRDHKNLILVILAASLDLETKPLHKSVALGDYNAVRTMLANDPAMVNDRNYFGWTPLDIAVFGRQNPICVQGKSRNSRRHRQYTFALGSIFGTR